MEYYISKDQSIAFKIFELGMKKFSDEPKYILAYLDYLSHMNGRCQPPVEQVKPVYCGMFSSIRGQQYKSAL